MDDILHCLQINMAAVLDYQPGRAIPQITMEIARKQFGEEEPRDKYVTMQLSGVHEQGLLLRLMCVHHRANTGQFKCTALHACLEQLLLRLHVHS